MLKDSHKTYRIVDLFAGAGGLTLGFTQMLGHVFTPVWANDFNLYAAGTYNANFGEHCTTDDIVEIVEKRIHQIPKADVVIGGPPCQGFSLLNKQREGDSRKQLWRPYLQIVEHTGAEIFVMENVPQLLGSAEHEQIADVAHSLGFKMAFAKLCAADYGVPQTRWRAFIVGCKFVHPGEFFPPKKTHQRPSDINTGMLFSDDFDVYVSKAKTWRTVRDAIGDLPPPQGTEIRDELPPLDIHFGRTPTTISMKRYRAIPKEGMNRFDLQKKVPELTPACWIRKKTGGTDLFGRLWWDRPAFTIRTEFFKPEKGRYLHPCQHRPITHREAARLQSFPDAFKFIGSKIEIAKQIGNAVPPMLAARIADSVLAMLNFKEENYGRQVLPGKAQPNNGKYQRAQYST
ncbi:MAG: DNA cytosine methyltransferase [Candidatus Moranbacteria bacterium]|nr:DNA cytosine methyltransferase [Candidatus Moranbacteria bacterium]